MNTTQASNGAVLAPLSGSAPVDREKKVWWSATEYRAKKVTGLSCAPSNPDVWWCPEVGYSLTEKHSLFETEEEAVKKCIADLEAQAATIATKLAALRKQND